MFQKHGLILELVVFPQVSCSYHKHKGFFFFVFACCLCVVVLCRLYFLITLRCRFHMLLLVWINVFVLLFLCGYVACFIDCVFS